MIVEGSSSYGTVRLLNRDVGFLLVFLLVMCSKENPALNPVTTSQLFSTFMVCTRKEIYAKEGDPWSFVLCVKEHLKCIYEKKLTLSKVGQSL